MKTRNTLILLLIAIALLGFIAFWERRQPSTREAVEQSRHVVHFERDNIDGISIVNNETHIELRKNGNQWRIESPVKDRADMSAAEELLTSAEMLTKEETLGESEKDAAQRVKDFGLAQSNTRLKLLGKGAPPEMLFGKDSAIPGKIYMRLDGPNTIYVTSNELRNQVVKSADDFRDHRLTDLNAQQVDRCVVKSETGEIELQKDGAHWQIKKPIKARGDDQKIGDMIAQAINTRIEKFIPDNSPNASVYGLSDSKRAISFFQQGSDKPAALQLGAAVDKEPDKVYAKLSSRDSVFTLPKSAQDALDVKPNDLRDKNLLQLNLDIVDRINIEPDGKPRIVLARKEEDWILKGPPDSAANAAAVKAMVTALQQQRVTAFVADVASDLAKYGLDHPQLRVTFSSYASENTAETQAGENAIVTVSFGKIEGENIYARLENEPFIVSLSKSALGSIRTDSVQWQGLAIFKFKPEDISVLAISRENHLPITIMRDAKSGWKLAGGTGALDETNIQSLCNTLASLRAVRWTRQETGGLGFDKPSLAIVFTPAHKANIKLIVGDEDEGFRYATAETASGVFLISKPDFEALRLPILQTAQPAPVATPGVSPPATSPAK